MIEGLLNPKRWANLFDNIDIFLEGLLMTLQVAVLGFLLALCLGILFGVFSVAKNKALQFISRVYVEIFQNTPLVVQVFFYYNGLPLILKELLGSNTAVRIPKLVLGLLGVGLYHGAYIAEVIRTGIGAIPRGQYEAAQSQGFTGFQTMTHIILPQTFKIILPPLANQILNLVKNTSVLALIAGGDLMYHADNYVSQNLFLQGYILCAAFYFVLCYPLALLAKHLENRAKQTPSPRRSSRSKTEVVS